MIIVAGIGQCGGNLLASLMGRVRRSKARQARNFVLPVLINSNANDQRRSESSVPRRYWIGIGKTGVEPAVMRVGTGLGRTPLYEAHITGGLGEYFDNGFETFVNQKTNLRNLLEEKLTQEGQQLEAVSLVVVLAGLGKGTGSGGTPVVAEIAQDWGKPVIVVAVLPSEEVEGGRLNAGNAIKSLIAINRRLERKDIVGRDASHGERRSGLIIVDNGVLVRAKKNRRSMPLYNEYIGGCLYDMYVAPSVEGEGLSGVNQGVGDIQDHITRLRFGQKLEWAYVGALGQATFPLLGGILWPRKREPPAAEELMDRCIDQLTLRREGEVVRGLFGLVSAPVTIEDGYLDDIKEHVSSQITRQHRIGYTPSREPLVRSTVCAAFRPEEVRALVRLRARVEERGPGQQEEIRLGKSPFDPL